jgi:hypothetical protein
LLALHLEDSLRHGVVDQLLDPGAARGEVQDFGDSRCWEGGLVDIDHIRNGAQLVKRFVNDSNEEGKRKDRV